MILKRNLKMPKVKDIYDYIDSLAPFANQCEWDNSGIATGNPEGEVTKIVFALDITNDVVDYAREVGAELAVSHHPVIFRARKSVLSNDPVYALVNAGISAICAHTSLDIADGGINDALTEKLGFGKCAPLTSSGEASMVRVYEFGEERSPEDVAAFVAEKLGAAVRYSDCGKPVRKVALCGGAGCDFLPDVISAGCDMLITGDASHHDFLDAANDGVCVIAAGHYETENPVMEVLAAKIKEKFNVETYIAPSSSPCQTVVWI